MPVPFIDNEALLGALADDVPAGWRGLDLGACAASRDADLPEETR